MRGNAVMSVDLSYVKGSLMVFYSLFKDNQNTGAPLLTTGLHPNAPVENMVS